MTKRKRLPSWEQQRLLVQLRIEKSIKKLLQAITDSNWEELSDAAQRCINGLVKDLERLDYLKEKS